MVKRAPCSTFFPLTHPPWASTMAFENDPPSTEGHVWLAQFFIETMNIAEDNGYKLALFSYSVGVPRWCEWEAIVETRVFGRAKEGGHVLALHEYNWPVCVMGISSDQTVTPCRRRSAAVTPWPATRCPLCVPS
jgi:hypothetical protein